VIVCYLDDSGEASEPIITMAGLVSTADLWLEFEECARGFFDDIGIRYLHTVDLHHRRGQFDGRTSHETATFANAFFRLVEDYAAFGVEFSVLKSRFRAAKEEYGLKGETSPLSMCFRGVLDVIVKDEGFRSAERYDPSIDLSFVVERGHVNNQDVLQHFNKIKEMDPKRFGSLTFEDKKKRIALQAADFIAFYSRRIRNASITETPRTREIEFFRTTLGDLKHRQFLATDFGAQLDAFSASEIRWKARWPDVRLDPSVGFGLVAEVGSVQNGHGFDV
jgi:Protein of unknown function (DUF3800)